MDKDLLRHLYSRDTLCAQPSAIRDICALVARPEVRSLAGEERVREVARMLGGDPESTASRDHARELLGLES